MKDSWEGTDDPLSALRSGDPAPFEDFVRSETRAFLAFFIRLGAGRSEAEDLVQETFLKLFRSAATSRATSYDARGRFAGYAFRVARNVWIDRRRRLRLVPTDRVEAELQVASDGRTERSVPAPDAPLLERESSEVIRAVVGALPEGHRAVFELAVIEELSYSAISEALEIPIGTVKSRLHSAVLRVRAALQERERVQEALLDRANRARGERA